MTAETWIEHAAAAFDKPYRPAWRDIARPEQLPPPGDWLTWAYLAGRGAGKTRSASEWVHAQAMTHPGCRIALIGRTPADVRDVMIEGDSGILAVAHEDAPIYQSTKRRLTWANGSIAQTYSAEVPSQLRGPQHHYAWADEAAAWTDAPKGDVLDTAWNNLMLGLRLGSEPRCVVTTTPKPNALTRTILERPSTVVTRGSTYDNLKNLAPSFREQVLATYEGTRIGRQELMGELLDDVEGALWTLGLLDETRVHTAPDLQRIVVAVDPSGGTGPNSDEQGIVVAGRGVDGHLYVLADRSCALSPHGWASRAVAAYHEYSADRIVAERNYGGDMVESTIRQVDKRVPVKVITASRGKVQRAEPVAALYEQQLVHHVGALPKLEDQMTTWTPQSGTSPDRMDACLVAGTPVLTMRGEIPIQDVHVGDLAWTRKGWRRVAASALTRHNAQVIAVELTNGQTLTGTPDHRVWVEGFGWKQIDALVWGDRMSAWMSPLSPSPIEASSTSGTPTANSELTVSTTSRLAGAAGTPCIETSGVITTTATYPTAGTSTTSTKIPSTTTHPTSNCSPLLSTPESTSRSTASAAANGSTQFATWPPNGIEAMRVARGTASMESELGKTASPIIARSASRAATSSKHGSTMRGTAPGAASTEPVRPNTSKWSPARSAGASSTATATGNVPRPAHASVVRSCAVAQPLDVYDLTVEDAHEFVAAGVIVHNCVWAVTELTDNFNAHLWIDHYRRLAETATQEPEPQPPSADATADDPMAALRAARHAAYRAQR